MRRALVVIVVAGALDVLGGALFALVEHVSLWIGLYWAVVTATTTGYGDVIPHTGAGHLIAVGVMLTVIPLFAATFSLFTSSLTGVHIKKNAHDTHNYLRHIIKHHPDIPDMENQ